MVELKPGDNISLKGGTSAKVIKELGRGGQGIVYLVELGGTKMALKWYIHAPSDVFYKNLEENISKGAPSDAFLWPEYLTAKQKGSYGYVMKLRPQGYYEFGQYLLARVQFNSYEAMLNAAMKICEGFMKLHLNGYSYQDLNDGNFFIHPDTGDVLICDNDNVMPQGSQSGILGKARYMAPEIVLGKNMPDKYSDRYSLAVILFLLFYGGHPLEGKKVLSCSCMTESYEKKFYGSEATFVYDDTITDNRPVRGVHNNVITFWMLFPESLRMTFKQEFSQENLRNPLKRMIEAKWQKIIQELRDRLVVCPFCGDDSFVEDEQNSVCINCKRRFAVSGTLSIGSRKIYLTPKTKVYIDLDNKPDMLIVAHPGGKYPAFIKNTTQSKWVVETQSGNLKPIEPGEEFPVRKGLKVVLSGAEKGELI